MKTTGRGKVCWVYVTAPDRAEARRIARAMVQERLAACANILGTIDSVYRWQGKIEEGKEVALVLKTTYPRFPALCKRIVDLHSYECPCIEALPATAGHAPFLAWVQKESRAAPKAARCTTISAR